MDLTRILIYLMLFAILLSVISIVMVIVFLLKTNSKIKGLSKMFKLYSINNLIEKVMKKNDNQYENPGIFYENFILKKHVNTAAGVETNKLK